MLSEAAEQLEEDGLRERFEGRVLEQVLSEYRGEAGLLEGGGVEALGRLERLDNLHGGPIHLLFSDPNC